MGEPETVGPPTGALPEPPVALAAALRRFGLPGPGDVDTVAPLSGGVSSEIWRVGDLCVKRALPRLRVADEWHVPTTRNHYEAAWLEVAAARVPGSAPAPVASGEGVLVLPYLEPAAYPTWKPMLLAGRADPEVAEELGRRLVAVHARTAGDAALAERFASDALFHALRLEPYFLAAARRHPRHASRLRESAETTAKTRRALVHGDVSPKNVLVGPDGPMLIDAECAWYGDPAFDLAFPLNHLMLKCAARPESAAGYAACFDALTDAYLPGVDWEDADGLAARAAGLLPALLLARVDGRSPVEYLDEPHRALVRRTALGLLDATPTHLAEAREAIMTEVDR